MSDTVRALLLSTALLAGCSERPKVVADPRSEWAYIDHETARLRVEGGWLYRATSASRVSIAFVPDTKEVRDAE